ncbi:MAG: hypothetical protein RMI04_08845 [Thermofilaceae archaeon]|nr:hypothetical protein [Thermofilaceae archaeon]
MSVIMSLFRGRVVLMLSISCLRSSLVFPEGCWVLDVDSSEILGQEDVG